MKDVLVIKTESTLATDVLHKLQLDFAEQLKSGVVIIPPYFDAKIINVPDDIEVIVQAKEKPKFIEKDFSLDYYHVGVDGKIQKGKCRMATDQELSQYAICFDGGVEVPLSVIGKEKK